MPPATIKYRAAHVFTTARVPDEMLKQLRDAPVLVQRLLTFTELNLDLMAIEQRVFSLDHGRALEVLFGPAEGAAGLSAPHRMALALEKQEMVQEIARNLLTLCHLIGEVPRIRYQRSACGVAESVAQALHEAIEEYEASVPGGMRGAQQTAQELTVTAADADSPTSERAAERSHTVLIILDRSIDPVAPLLHEFTYQAMCNDLLAVDTVDTGGARYAYTVRGKDAEAPVPQEALLDEYADAAWPELRHLHLMDVIGRINAAIRGSVATPRSGLSRDEDVLSASGAPSLWPALTESPRFLSPMQQQRIGKYAVHMDLVDCCMRLFRERHLQRTALCEQDLACGLIDCQGKSMEAAEAAQRTALILRDEHVPIEDKIRLLAVVVATMDVSARDVDDLLDAMGDVGSGKEVISGLLRSMLGVHLRKDVAEVQALAARALRHFQGGGGNGAPHTHDLSRFVPLVRDVAEAAARGRLSTRAFPTRDRSARRRGGRRCGSARAHPVAFLLARSGGQRAPAIDGLATGVFGAATAFVVSGAAAVAFVGGFGARRRCARCSVPERGRGRRRGRQKSRHRRHLIAAPTHHLVCGGRRLRLGDSGSLRNQRGVLGECVPRGHAHPHAGAHSYLRRRRSSSTLSPHLSPYRLLLDVQPPLQNASGGRLRQPVVRALIADAPEGDLRRYESQVAHLAGVQTRIVFHLLGEAAILVAGLEQLSPHRVETRMQLFGLGG
eukprot:ctg_878.g380